MPAKVGPDRGGRELIRKTVLEAIVVVAAWLAVVGRADCFSSQPATIRPRTARPVMKIAEQASLTLQLCCSF